MEDTIEVTPSVESGNVPVETPSEEPKTETPTEPVETVTPTEPEAKLYDLPDGRKVDGETLAKEWKENFLPDYTRKSMALADIEKAKTINPTSESPYADPNYQPKSWEEILEVAKQRALEEVEAREHARAEERQAAENAVIQQLTEIKAIDPKLNEDALFLHANKYGFKDLKLAHQNMNDMAQMAKKVQQTTVQNIAKRNDPVSTTQGAPGGSRPNPSSFSSAVDYLRSLNK